MNRYSGSLHATAAKFKADRRRHPGLRKELRVSIPPYNPHQAVAVDDDEEIIWAYDADAILAELEASTTESTPLSSWVEPCEANVGPSDTDTWTGDDGEETDTDILAVLMDGDCSDHETRGPATRAKNPDGGDALLDCESDTLSLLQPQNTGWVEVADAPLFLPEGPVACTTSSDDNGCIYCE